MFRTLTSLVMLAVLSGCDTLILRRINPEKEYLRALAEINEDLRVQSDFLELLRIQRLLTAKLKEFPFVRDARATLRWETPGSIVGDEDKPRVSVQGLLSYTAIVETAPGRQVRDREISRSVEMSLKECGLREIFLTIPTEARGWWVIDGTARAPEKVTAATAPKPESKE